MAIQDGTVIQTPTAEITLTVYADGTLVGYGGCNNYNAVYTLTGATLPKGNGIVIGPVTSTKMYCQATSNQETTYYQILGDSLAYIVNSNQLTITAKNGNALLYETPQAIVTQTRYPEPG
jgi:heat shock protein HslJ